MVESKGTCPCDTRLLIQAEQTCILWHQRCLEWKTIYSNALLTLSCCYTHTEKNIIEGSDHLTEAEWTSSCKIQFGCQGWCCYTCTKRMWMVPYLHIEALWRESRSDNSLRESRKSNWLEVLWWLVSGAGFVPVLCLCGTNLQAVPRARALKPPQVQDRGKKGVLWLESCQRS